MQAKVPQNIRLKNGKVPAFLKGAMFQVEDETVDEEDEMTASIAADMLSIKERLRVETEFEGIDAWDLKEEEFERAMELGLLPLPMIADYIADMVILAKLRKLGRPIPLWAVRMIEASTFIQRRWREKAKKFKFMGHAAAVDSLFGGTDFSDFSAAPQQIKKENKEKPEDRFWKAYLQHVKRVHAGQGNAEPDTVFEDRVEKTLTKLKSVKYLKNIESMKHHDGLILSPTSKAASKAKPKSRAWA